jgi:chorismate mutase/prephenate dehydratase
MEDLKKTREEIDRIDKEMRELFEKRMTAVEKVADYKREHGLPVKDEEREEYLIRRNSELLDKKEISDYYVLFQKKLMDLSCDYQNRINKKMKVAYNGVEGAFAWIAATRLFPGAELISFGSFEEAYAAVENGKADTVILPIENSYAGEVVNVMDLMFSGNLYVNSVIDIDIVHNLMAPEGATIESIKKVVSHTQALSQCDAYIRSHGFEPVAYTNTAMAAEYVKSLNDPTVAAIASKETAELKGLKLLETGINASRSNTTRFAAFSRGRNVPGKSAKNRADHFILVFTVKNEAGALAQTLNIIGAHNFNMRSLRSRPMKDLMWNYYFYIEADGDIYTRDGQDALNELGALCANLKLVGTY